MSVERPESTYLHCGVFEVPKSIFYPNPKIGTIGVGWLRPRAENRFKSDFPALKSVGPPYHKNANFVQFFDIFGGPGHRDDRFAPPPPKKKKRLLDPPVAGT